MGKLKTLQNRFKKGEITLAQYRAELQKLLEEEFIEQDVYDEALEFDPEADKPIYTQADVDGMIVKKANAIVKKMLKEAGAELDGVSNKEVMTKASELVKAGIGKPPATTDDAEIKKLQAKAKLAETSLTTIKDLSIENAVLKVASKFNPLNPIQVVRALKLDYMDLVDYDEETGVDTKTVEKALKRIKDNEPNLFADTEDEPDDESNKQFKGKGPGSGAGSGSKEDKEYAANLAKAKEMLGIKEDKK